MPETITAAWSTVVGLLLVLFGVQSKRQDRLQRRLENCDDVRVEKEDIKEIKDDIKMMMRDNSRQHQDIMLRIGREEGRHKV